MESHSHMQPSMKPVQTSGSTQTIVFSGRDDENSIEVVKKDVTIVPSSGDHESGSSKVKIKNIVDYSWELKFYTGQLLAVHVNGKHIAYGIKTVGKSAGVVRVVNRDSNERSLIKGMEGMVQDIAFAHIPTQIILACVDEFGNLLIHQIEETAMKMTCTLILHVERSKDSVPVTNHRVIWCPYIPEDDGDVSYDDVAKLLVLTHDSKAELWDINVVSQKYGVGPLRADQVKDGYLEVQEHSQAIVDAAFSPDGTALATASLDGEVKFFQVYMQNNDTPRCLHQWKPHDGKPLSSLFFLDNHKAHNPEDQFWKFALTGAENNSEIKIWSCESWSCLQTIKFKLENSSKGIVLKAGLDLTAGYLLLSDIYNKLLYVLQIQKNSAETCAIVTSVSEFLLPSPILSFGIVDAGIRNFKSSSFEEICNDEVEDDQPQFAQAVVRMYLVQPKSLQECHIAFQPPTNFEEFEKLTGSSHDSLGFRDNFSDLSSISGNCNADSENMGSDKQANQVNEVHQSSNRVSQPLNLMTPDAFSSPAKKDSPTEAINSLGPHSTESSPHIRILDAAISGSPPIANTVSTPIDDIIDLTSESPQPLATSEVQPSSVFVREGFASGGSSPSREVQQILSSQDSECCTNDFYEKEDEEKARLSPKLNSPKDSTAVSEKDEGISSKSSGTDGAGWPQIPASLVKEVESANIRAKAAHVEQSVPFDTLNTLGNEIMEQYMGLENKFSSVMTILQEQQKQYKVLLEEVRGLNRVPVSDHRSSPVGPRLETLVLTRLENSLKQHEQQMVSMLRQLVLAQEEHERKRQEALMSALTQAFGNLISTKLEDVVCTEIKSNVVPAVIAFMEPLKHQLHIEMAQKLTSTDHLLKENIAKLVQSKSVMEVLSNSVVAALQPSLQLCYRDAFASTVLPCFEKACQNMFQQINDSFSKGTKEYVQIFDNHFDKQRRQQEKCKDVVSQLQSLSESLRYSSDSLPVLIQKEVQTQVQKSLLSIQESLLSSVSLSIKDNIAKGFQAQQAVIEDSVITAVRSRAVTPSPHIIDTHVQQAQIMQLIKNGQINAAFQQALSASDLSLVVFVCEKVNPQQVFNQSPCPLQQHVLLSLIQQLSADMANHTEIKHKYLEEAVMNLEPNNPVTREHIPTVITNLQHQLAHYINNNPNNKITRSMKMLHMATLSLVNSA